MKQNRLLILTALLIGISSFSVFQYIVILREKQNILISLNQIKSKVSGLESEKQNLVHQLEERTQLTLKLAKDKQLLQEDAELTQKKLALLQEDLVRAKNNIKELYSDLENLKQENLFLKQDRDEIVKEKSFLEARFKSLKELKMAIKELKSQMRKVGTSRKRIEDKLQFGEGNRGFIIKDGTPTLGAKVRIKVIPVQ